jgi:UDP-glucose 4-epimerase
MKSASFNMTTMNGAFSRLSSPAVCLVTGVAGFIGSNLTEALLARGYRVIGIDDLNDYYSPELKQDNLASLLTSDSFLLRRCDLNSLSAEMLPDRIDYVFHLAGQPGVRSSWSNSFDSYVSRNILATQRLLEIVVHCHVKRFIFASSSSIYGQADGPVTESTVPHPLSPYAATKLAAEGLCLAYNAGYSLPLTILRYFTVYGPRQRPDMAIHKLLQAAVTKTPVPIYGNGMQRRAFTYVGDVVNATLAAMGESCEASIYNISGGQPASLNQCMAIIEEVTGNRIVRNVCDVQRGDPYETEADISQAQSHLKYQPQVSLETGIAQEWSWLQAQMSAQVHV